MLEADKVRMLMNQATQAGQEFLFGFDYEMKKGFFYLNPKSIQNILWRIGNHSNAELLQKLYREGLFFRAIPMAYREYEKRFQIVRHHLKHGNSFLANLTAKTEVHSDYSFEELFWRSQSPYAICVPNKFVCFSPETFVKVQEGKISSNPMKGTISGDIPNAETVILNDYKERAEHFTIVDFVRSELSRVGEKVNVTKLRYIDELNTSNGTILQVSSQIEAELLPLFKENLGDMFYQLLPAASICGAPKEATLKAIRQAEEEDRGFYTGVFGYFDGHTLDSAVMIRFIEQEKGHYYYRSGGGITINSQCKDEYDELLKKVYLPF